jgi:hypothetical protein
MRGVHYVISGAVAFGGRSECPRAIPSIAISYLEAVMRTFGRVPIRFTMHLRHLSLNSRS